MKSRHSEIRAQQRGIRDFAIDCALSFGREYYAGSGDLAYFLPSKNSKPEWKALPAEIRGKLKRLVVILTPQGLIKTVYKLDGSVPAHWQGGGR